MKFWLMSCLAAIALTACVTPPPPTHNPPPPVDMRGGMGAATPANQPAGCASLIPIYADTTGQGVAMEEAWVARNYPGARITGQQTTRCGDTMVDVLTIRTEAGAERTVWFDISSFFGKTDSGDLDSMLDG